uniref:Metalloendopeptidase n=1 Tax=Romanomermis culicivorax TaxID=13658 RepID=A0A915IL89_ROMCU
MIIFLVVSFFASVACLPIHHETTTKDGRAGTRYFNLTQEEIRKINEAQNDLIFTPQQKAAMRSRNMAFSARFWTDGVVPFEIDPSFHSLPQAAEMLQFAIDQYAKYTCIKLRPRQPQDRNYLFFYSGQGCFSYFGMTGGEQEVSMSILCNNYPQVILHEIGHALGLIHEQQRPDRDQYVEIYWKNILRSMASNFDKVPLKQDRLFPYDYTSMMHYDAWAFSMNSGYAMVAKKPGITQKMGWYEGFSQSDIDRINYYYKCNEKKA